MAAAGAEQRLVDHSIFVALTSLAKGNGAGDYRPLACFSGFEGGLTVTDINDFNGPAQTTNLGVRSSNLFGRATYQIFQQVKHFRCYRVVTVRACCFEYHKVKWK